MLQEVGRRAALRPRRRRARSSRPRRSGTTSSWVNVDLGGGQAIDVAKPLHAQPAGADSGVQWGANAADMAYILYQEPVMVGVHGRNMLKNLKPAA